MNNNIIKEKVRELDTDEFNELANGWYYNDDGYESFQSFLRTALLEVEQATVADMVSTFECGCSHCHERAELVISKFIRKTITPTNNNKEV